MSLYQMRNSNVQTVVANLVPQQTSFSNAPITGVLSLSGGDVTGLSVSNVSGPVKILQSVGRQGTFTAAGIAEVDVVCAGLTANSIVLLSVNTFNTTVGAYVFSRTVGVGFSIKSVATDASIYSYIVLDTA